MASVGQLFRDRRVVGATAVVVVLVVVGLIAAGLGWGPFGSEDSSDASASPSATSSSVIESSTSTETPTRASRTAKPSKRPGGSGSAGPTSVPPSAPTAPSETPSPVTTGVGDPAPLGDGVEVTVAKDALVQGEANGPGEVAGPAVRVSVTVENTGKAALPLDTAVLNLYYGPQRTPAETLSGPGVVSLPATVAPGDTATAKFVFKVPTAQLGRVVLEFINLVDQPLLVFSGSLA